MEINKDRGMYKEIWKIANPWNSRQKGEEEVEKIKSKENPKKAKKSQTFL